MTDINGNTGGTAGIFAPTMDRTTDVPPMSFAPEKYVNRNGLDVIWQQKYLQEQMGALENDMRAIQRDGNLSDTEKSISMQQLAVVWSHLLETRTTMIKVVSNALKSILRNFP